MPTRMITFEGSDLSGKTETVKFLSKYLLNKGYNVIPNTGTIHKKNPVKIKNPDDELETEKKYTEEYLKDNLIDIYHPKKGLFIQDRTWISVISYGRFLNKENSIHQQYDYSGSMIQPQAIIYLKCSIDAKIKRAESRIKTTNFDKYLLKNVHEFSRLENEILKVIGKYEKVFEIDTTIIPIEQVSYKVANILKKEGIL